MDQDVLADKVRSLTRDRPGDLWICRQSSGNGTQTLILVRQNEFQKRMENQSNDPVYGICY